MQLIGDFLVRLGLPHQIHDLSFPQTEVAPDRPGLAIRPSTSLADPFRAAAAEINSAPGAVPQSRNAPVFLS
jgi:hypothetical protein